MTPKFHLYFSWLFKTSQCRPRRLARVLLVFGFVIGSCGVSNVSAQTTKWLGGTGNWFDVSNWDTGLPSSTTAATIDNGNPINSDVTFNGNGIISNLTIDAGDTLRIQNSRRLSVKGTGDVFTNNGLIQLEGTGFTQILVDRSGAQPVDLTFAGNGTVRLTDHNHSITSFGEPTLVNGVEHTIEGLGRVGNVNMRLTNQGLMNGNVGGGNLTIESGDSFINTGTVRASNGGTVNMFSQNNAGNGLYEATGTGSTIHFLGASVSDATFNGTNGGLVFKNSAGVIDLDNVTNLGTFRAQSVRLIDNLNNQGNFVLVNGFNNNIELGTSNVHINGGGSIDFTQGGPNVTGGLKLFNNDNTFTGFGQFETEIQFAAASGIAPGTGSDATASFDFDAATTFDGRMILELGGTDVNDSSPFISQVNTHTRTSMNALDFDQLNIFDSATFNQNARLDVELTNGFTPAVGDFFDLITADQFISIGNLNFDLPVVDGLTFDHQFLTLFDPSTGFDRDVLRITFGAAAVPEPNAVFLSALLLLTGLTRHRRRATR